MPGDATAPRLVVMGPSGCGKSTLARALASMLHYRFIEGDDLHPARNVLKMRAGVPLEDADRGPWLDAVGAALGVDPEQGVVAACSALKRRYRDRLRAVAAPLLFILPVTPEGLLQQRLERRSGHYMSTSLLASQVASLEPLAREERGFTTDGTAPVSAQLEDIRMKLAAWCDFG